MDELAIEKIQFIRALDALIDYHNLARARINALKKRETTQMNWLALIMKSLTAIPAIVVGIEHIHGDAKSGVQKKQLAMEALGLSSAVAGGVIPEQQAAIDAATALASNTIDGVVAVMNASKSSAAPSPAPTMPIPAPTMPDAGQTVVFPTSAPIQAQTPQEAPSKLNPQPPVANWP